MDDRTAMTRAEARAYDAWCTRIAGVPGLRLMEQAAQGIAAVAQEMLAPISRGGANVEVLAGPGNNGGDGYECARLLAERGVPVRIVRDAAPRPGTDAAAVEARAAAAGIPVIQAGDAPALGTAPIPSLVIDAILGTGFAADRTLEAGARSLIRRARRAAELGIPVLAVDLPSGMDADLGPPADQADCVRAHTTVTMVARKRGFDAPGAAALLGRVIVVPILPPGIAGPPAA